MTNIAETISAETITTETISAHIVQTWLITWLAAKLGFATDSIDPQKPFAEYGLDSLTAVELAQELQDWLPKPLEIDAMIAWDYPTPAALADYIAQAFGLSEKAQSLPATTLPKHEQAIAIIGIGLRFPGAANDAASFWQLLCSQTDPVGEIPADRWNIDDYYDPTPATPGKINTRKGAFLNDIDQFDARFFGISAQLAEQMDPQQRLLLEVCWEALANAGIAPEQLAGSATGVFVGISTNDYAWLTAQSGEGSAYRGLGNAHAIAANHISYLLNLHGPSLALDTACSSSLVAIHQACRSLRTGEIDHALVGGVNLALTPDLFITFSNARMLSPQGRCATFDADADGYVRGEGAGMVVLKRLADAEQDGDPILAVIRGSAVNQDGRSNGLTAPSGSAQQAVIRAALADAQVAPDQISYMETHGTGTPLGDPIEVNALAAVLLAGRHPDQFCWIGAVKSQIGHLEAAAGMAGLIKTILCLQQQTLPANLHLQTVNPHIRLEGTPLKLLRTQQPWTTTAGLPRLAGVSAFGFGGTNAHLILEEAPPRPSVQNSVQNRVERPRHLLTLSAKNEAALRTLAQNYADSLQTHPTINFADFCFTANHGRSHFDHRLALSATNGAEMQQMLSAIATSTITNSPLINRNRPSITFLFSGQGSQYVQMGRQLYETQPTFRRILDECDAFATPLLGQSLINLLYPFPEEEFARLRANPARPRAKDQPSHDQPAALYDTALAQPLLFAFEYALCELWHSWGIIPNLVIGHSVGELVAACVAGAFTWQEGLQFVIERGRLMQSLEPTGAMAAIFADTAQVQNVIAAWGNAIEIAAINAPQNVVIAGDAATLDLACAAFASRAIESQRLPGVHAFHSAQMESILPTLTTAAKKIDFQPLQIALVSNQTGAILPVGTQLNAEHWVGHARQAVQFMPSLAAAIANKHTLFLEVGPHALLSNFGKQLSPNLDWHATLRRNQPDWNSMLDTLAQLYQRGVAIDWKGFDGDYIRHSIAIPAYPFQRQRYWVTAPVLLPETAYVNQPTKIKNIKNILWEFNQAESNGETANHKPKMNQTMSELHHKTILASLQKLTAQLLHLPLHEVNGHTPLIELGADSLILLDAMHQIEATYHVKLSIRSFFEELATLDALATFLAEQTVPTEPIAVPIPPANVEKAPAEDSTPASSLSEIISLFERQIEALQQLTSQQLSLLSSVSSAPPVLPLVKTQNGNGVSPNGKNHRHGESSPTDLSGIFSPDRSVDGSSMDGAKPSPTPSIRTVPLSEAQQQLWFLSQMSDEASLAYNESVSLWLRGSLQIEHLHDAVQTLVDRHEALRTTIDREGDVQHILPNLALTLPLVDLAPHNGTSQQERVDAWFAVESRQPVDLATGPLFRVHLLKLATDEHVLVLTAHHIIIDGGSLAVLLHELSELYSANCRGEALNLPPALQFSQHVTWQIARRNHPELATAEKYWLQSLSGDLPVLELPLDRPRPPFQSYRGAIESLRLDNQLNQALQQFSRQQGSTLFMTLLAAYFTLLHRLSGQEDVIVGVPTAGRALAGGENLVGYCTHLLPVRSQLAGNPSFATLLNTVRTTLLDAYEHAEVPFARLINKLNLSRDLSLSPILSSTFNLNAQMATPPFHGLTTTIGPRPTSFVDHELSVNVLDTGAELVIDFEYNCDLFDAATVQRIASHFATLLRALVANPQESMLALPLLNAAERQQLLIDWNATAMPFDATLGFHQLFEAQVAKTPDAIAVIYADNQNYELRITNYENHGLDEPLVNRNFQIVNSLTYAQLNAAADCVADSLRAHGVESEVLVALLCERSPDFLAAMIGVFKAGGAYLPLDVRAPAARQNQILAQSRAPLLLISDEFAATAEEALAAMPVEQRPQVLRIEALLTPTEEFARPRANPARPRANTEEDIGARLAYVIYTSGSTGMPKGAMVEQRGMINHLYAKIKDLQLSAADSVAQTAPQSFDISVWQFLSPLIVGGRVHIFPDEIAGDAHRLLQETDRQAITILEVVPSLLRMMLDEVATDAALDLTRLRWMIPTGEALPPNLARRWMTQFPTIPMVNAYGPTECSDDVTHYPIFAPPSESVVNMPIGRPVVNMRMYILDSQLQAVPIGVAGELYVGGIGVGRGYIHDPERTAQSFVADPFSTDPTARLYKTGDKARYLPDGNIEYLGRLDYQVKIRGFRIELGEIEAVLEQHPAVDQAVVVDRVDASGNKRLVAYVVEKLQVAESQSGKVNAITRSSDSATLQPATLRSYMNDKLPDYMVPSAFIVLDAIPLTPNGKIDRKALPIADLLQNSAQSEIVLPTTATESALVEIWAEVLNLQPTQIGIHHDFFELGGHSLLATQAASRIRQNFGIDLPLRTYFNEPTIADLATVIDAARWGIQSPQLLSNLASAEREIGELL